MCNSPNDRVEHTADLEARLARGEASDGFHTHNELYEYRLLYNAHAANEWARHGTYPVTKSWRHHDGTECLGGGWFIVVATLPDGQVSNHYRAQDWELFNVPEVEQSPQHDGHDSREAAISLRNAIAASTSANRNRHLEQLLMLETQLREIAYDLDDLAKTETTPSARELAIATATALREAIDQDHN